MKAAFPALIAIALAFFPSCQKRGAAADAGKPDSITVMVYDRGTDGGKSDPASNNWTKWIQEKVLKDENISVTFVPVNRWDETSVITNLMASGAAPDLCYTYNYDMVNAYGLQGGVYDLAPYVDTLLADLKEFLGPDPQIPGEDFIMRSRNQDNGALYGISNRYVYSASYNLFMRKDWLDKLGLPVPQTPDEYFDALLAFKEKDPGGVGKNKVIPFTLVGNDVRWSAGIILESFIDPYLSHRERWINTVAERYALVPGYREGMRFLNKMYNAGLVDRDFPLYVSDEIPNNLVKSGVVGSLAGNWDQVYRENVSLMSDLQKNVPGALYVPVDCFPSADGVTHKRGAPVAGGLTLFIPSSSKKPQAAMRYANWLGRYENCSFLQFGNEGVNHVTVNGVPKTITASGGWIQNSQANLDYTPSINGYAMETQEMAVKVLANSYPWPEEYIAEAYRISSLNAEPPPVVQATLYVSGPLTQILVDKSKVFYVASIIAAPGNFDRVWDEGVKDWLASGAQAVIDERREKYPGP
ncbi:MAG: extracellular solute-binding protein [Treponema sp.]|nr:extracellular solute-binding protein [Treponema sp.]